MVVHVARGSVAAGRPRGYTRTSARTHAAAAMNCATHHRSRANARLALISLSIRRTTDAAAIQQGWRWIGGQPSAVAEALSPPSDSDVFLGGSFTQVPGSARELRDTLLLGDGSNPDLYHSGLQHQGVARRFSAADDEKLPPFPEALGLPPHLKKYVEAIERLPLEEMPAAAARMTMQEGVAPKDLIAAVVVAGSRSCELVADHHGGPLHITAGAWAVLVAAAHLRDASPTWAKLALAQAIANANRHVQVGFKLGGTVRMPLLEAAEAVHSVGALAMLSNAIREQRPNAAERCLVAAVDAQCSPGSILSILLEEALPRNCQDDHYFLYPIFAMQTLELIGWEHATVVLRPVVRYLSTTPAAGSIDPARFSEAFRTGVADSDPTWSRILAADAARPVPDGNRGSAGPPPARMVEAVREWAHIRAAGGIWSPLGNAVPPVGGLRRRAGEAGRSVALGEMLSDTAAHDHDRLAVYKAVPDVLSAVLKDGLSVEAALDGLSLGAVRLYLRSEIGNPVDVHLITGIGARRYLLEQSDVASATVAFSLLLWASGFEVSL